MKNRKEKVVADLTQLGELSDALTRIKELEADLAGLSDAKEQIETLEAKVKEQQIEIDDLSDENDEHEKAIEVANGDAIDAIDRFLDEVQRPVGTRDFTVPKSDAATRALIGLYDAVGRGM